MNKEQLFEEINSMIDEEINIRNLQDDDFNPDVLNTLWKIKDLVELLE